MQVFKLNPGSLGNMAVAAMTLLSRLPFSWRGISALVLGILLAKWFWILLAPQPLYSAVRPGSTAANEAGLLFGTVQSGDTVNQGVALPNVQLLGIFSANAGKPGFAVLKLSENRQVGVAEGEEVATGTRLVAVRVDHVLLERAGVQQRVDLENKFPNAGVNKRAPASGAANRIDQPIDIHDKNLQSRLRQLSNQVSQP